MNLSAIKHVYMQYVHLYCLLETLFRLDRKQCAVFNRIVLNSSVTAYNLIRKSSLGYLPPKIA